VLPLAACQDRSYCDWAAEVGKAFTTDEQGRVTVLTPWSGYVLDVIYFEARAGGTGNDKTS